MHDAPTLAVNGVDGATGEYLIGPLGLADVVAMATGRPPEDAHARELRRWQERVTAEHLGPIEGVDATDLAQAGWGVVFPAQGDPAIRAALQPLLDLRRAQAGAEHAHRFRIFAESDGVCPGESKTRFLARHGIGFGPADPDRVPYYLLLVADPNEISFRFQYELDVAYAVGRVHFESVDDYAQYAGTIVRTETAMTRRPARATFVGVRNDDDRATRLSADRLIDPLSRQVLAERSDWSIDVRLGEMATKATFGNLLGGSDTPALLFAAGHGMGFPDGDPRRLPDQGALLCQDWPGPARWQRPVPPDFYFAADDVAADAHLAGLIAVLFACYGAGSPAVEPAHPAFLARLPQRLLAHPAGGALAVLGHVDRAWNYSFAWPQVDEQFGALKSMLLRLQSGLPVGHALEPVNQRYAELSTALHAELEDIKWGKQPDEVELARLWTASSDARSHVVIGDPAVRLSVPPTR